MEVGDREAEPSGRLEAARGSVHSDCRRRKRVVGWKYECSPVLPVMIGCIRRSGEDVMPSMVVSALKDYVGKYWGSGVNTLGCSTRRGGQR